MKGPVALLMLLFAGAAAAVAPVPTDLVQTLTPLAERSPAPPLDLPDLDGRRYRLSELRGQVVVVNFWATWCPPCREEMPSMQRVWEQVQGQGILILAVNVGEDQDTIFQFTANYPVEFPLLLDRDAGVTEAWPVIGLPTSFVVDAEGRLAYRAIGGRLWDAPGLLDALRGLAQAR